MKKASLFPVMVIIVFSMIACASMTLESLDTIEGPKQLRQGEDIAPGSITLYGIYKNGDRKTVSVNASDITFDKNAVGPQTVRVRKSGKEASFQTQVMALLSVNISSPPSTLIYKQGQDVTSWPGLAVQGEWDQMGSQNIPLSSTQITGYNSNRVGTQSITVSYIGKTASFNVGVVAMTAIRITQPPTKVDYAQGEALNLTGMRVVGVWEGLPEEQLSIAASDVTGYNANTAGIQRLTITKSGITATLNVEVLGLTSIIIDQPPTKTDYRVGEQLNLAGIVVNGNYTGTTAAKRMTQAIPAAQLTTSGFNSSAVVRNQRVTVTAGGQSANFFVNIAVPTPVAAGTVYVITGTAPTYSAAKGGTPLATTGTIQNVIDAIRTDAGGAAITIQFGNGTNVLEVAGVPEISFNNKGGTWGLITFTGKLKGRITPLVTIETDVSVTSSADIATEGRTGIMKRGPGTLTITGGNIYADDTTGSGVAIGSPATLNIQDGTIRAGRGVDNRGTTNIYGGNINGCVSTTGADARTNISGGTISAMAGINNALYIDNATVVLSGNATITSANASATSGTIYFGTEAFTINPALTISGNVTITNTARVRGLVYLSNPYSPRPAKIVDNRVNPDGGNLSN